MLKKYYLHNDRQKCTRNIPGAKLTLIPVEHAYGIAFVMNLRRTGQAPVPTMATRFFGLRPAAITSLILPDFC
ncbi:MAG: hypothetical protein WBJ10_10355 [Daejeonella sp.]|uniref:hypothetical protein n=1 Tax=Daejeonella sp. TaxID=2805397 RepID=UPI003C73468E